MLTFKVSAGWMVAIFSSVINFLILIKYQLDMGGTFPYEDEWGYVNRLSQIHSMGFYQFLFNKYQIYFVPGLFFIWYLFYHFFDLSIMAIRKVGAVTSAISSLLICAVILKQKSFFSPWELFLVALIPFVFCSLNYWATYNQSIEAMIEPFLLGCVILAIWAGQQSLIMYSNLKKTLFWSGLVIIFTLLSMSMYAPGLSILLAIAITRMLFLRKVDGTSLALGGVGLSIGVAYSFLGGGLAEHHIHFFQIFSGKFLEEWILLFGNSLITIGHPHSPIFYVFGFPITYYERVVVDFIFGFIVFSCIFTSMLYAIFVQMLNRIRYFVPFALSLYTIGVSIEIALTHHSPRFGEAPRYAILMVGAPIAVVLWGILIPKQLTMVRTVTGLAQAVVSVSVITTLIFVKIKMPQLKSFKSIKLILWKIDAPITKDQQKILKVNDPLRNLVYPDIQYLKKNHLACFRDVGKPENFSGRNSMDIPQVGSAKK